MRVLTKRLRLESRGFRYKVALYLCYLHIKFDDDTKESPFEYQVYFPIRLRPSLNSRLGLASFAASVAVTETCNTSVWQRKNV